MNSYADTHQANFDNDSQDSDYDYSSDDVRQYKGTHNNDAGEFSRIMSNSGVEKPET